VPFVRRLPLAEAGLARDSERLGTWKDRGAAAVNRSSATCSLRSPELIHAASAQKQVRVNVMAERVLPVSQPAMGLRDDTRLGRSPRPLALETIRVPTLAISARDDGFGTYAGAEYTATYWRAAVTTLAYEVVLWSACGRHPEATGLQHPGARGRGGRTAQSTSCAASRRSPAARPPSRIGRRAKRRRMWPAAACV